MLDFMRKYADKIIWIIIIAFILSLGILSFSKPQRGSGRAERRTTANQNLNELAYVNEKPIDQRVFARLYNVGLMNYRDVRQKDAIDPKIAAYIGYASLLQAIDMEKKLDYAGRLKVKVSGRDVKQQTEAIQNAYQIKDKADFEKLLAMNGLDFKSFQNEIRNELILNRLEDSVRRQVSVSEQDVKNQYERVKASHILIAFQRACLENKTDKERERLAGDIAANVYDQLRRGGDFAVLAKEYSDDPGSAVRGGDLGFFGVNMMVPEFEQVAFSLEPGQLSKPFQTQYGYHIVKVEAIEQDEIPLDVDEKEMQKTLLEQKQNSALQQLNRRLQQEYKTEIIYPEFLAFDHKVNGKLEEALNIYRRFGSQNAQSPIPYIFTAEIYELLDQNTEALAEYEKALLVQKLNPATRTPYVHFYLANLYAKQKQNAKALEQLQLAEAAVVDNLNILERIKDKYTELNAKASADKIALKIQAIENERAAAAVTADAEVQFED